MFYFFNLFIVDNVCFLKPRSHGPGFHYRRRYGVDTRANRDHTVATPARAALYQRSPGSATDDFNIFKTAGTHRHAQGCETTPAFSGASP